MKRRIPIAAAAFVARVFEEDVHRLHGVARGVVRKVGEAQMHRCDPRQALVAGVQGGGHGGQPRHDPAGGVVCSVSVAKQLLDRVALAHDEAAVAPLDQRRAAEQQALVGAGEAEIVGGTCFTETPDSMNHFGPKIGALYALSPIVSSKYDLYPTAAYKTPPSRGAEWAFDRHA